MSQYKPDGINYPTVQVTNGSASVVIVGVDATAEINQGDYFFVKSANTGRYEVSAAAPVYSGGNTTVTLTTNYAGATNLTAIGVFHRDFTAEFSLPLLQPNDLESANLISRCMQLIDAALINPTPEDTQINGILFVNKNAVTTAQTALSGTAIQVQGADANAARIAIDSFGGTPVISGRRSQGTRAAQTAVQTNHSLIQIDGYGMGATGFPALAPALMGINAAENWSDTAYGCYFYWFTTKAGGTTRSEKMRLHDEGWLLLGVTTPTLAGLSGTGQNVLEVRGSTARGAIIVSGGAADADAIVQGSVNWCDKNSLDADNRICFINGLTSGTTANHRGGAMVFGIKPDNVNGTAEILRLNQFGLGLGTATPNYLAAANTIALTIQATGFAMQELCSSAADANGQTIGAIDFNYRTNSANHQRIGTISVTTDGTTANQRGGRISFFTKTDGSTTLSERARFANNGKFLLNTTTDRTGQLGIDHAGVGSYAMALHNTDTGASSQNIIVFTRGAGVTTVGSITATNAATAYNTSSDYRLKQNVVDLKNPLMRLEKLQPRQFEFKSNPGQIVDGFIAHEAQDIVPGAVHGLKDDADADGNPIYQQVDYSKYVPLLVASVKDQQKTIRQQQELIEELIERINALEK